ncbi:MAG: hypothetical protein ACKOE2_04935 [Actinomycetales bacterium]
MEKVSTGREEGMLPSVVEGALRRELDQRKATTPWVPRSELVVGGSGLTPEAQGMSWAQIRDLGARPFHPSTSPA